MTSRVSRRGVTAISFVLVTLPLAATGSADRQLVMAPAAIAEAEAQGAKHPRPAANAQLNDFSLLVDPEGRADRRCVEAGRTTPRRSGDFFARFPDQLAVLAASAAGNPGRPDGLTPVRQLGLGVWWSPAHVPPSSGVPTTAMTLNVRAIRLDASAPDLTHTTNEWVGVFSSGRSGPMRYTYTMDTPPASGSWLYVATAGPNWGCFVYGSSASTLRYAIK